MDKLCPFYGSFCNESACPLWIEEERRTGGGCEEIDLTKEQRAAGCAFNVLGLAAREYIVSQNRWTL